MADWILDIGWDVVTTRFRITRLCDEDDDDIISVMIEMK
jgi:hypothetical protein